MVSLKLTSYKVEHDFIKLYSMSYLAVKDGCYYLTFNNWSEQDNFVYNLTSTLKDLEAKALFSHSQKYLDRLEQCKSLLEAISIGVIRLHQ